MFLNICVDCLTLYFSEGFTYKPGKQSYTTVFYTFKHKHMDNVLGKFAICLVVDICNVELYVLITETNCNVITTPPIPRT